MVNRFHMFSRFSEWRPYLCKWEIAGIRVLNGVKVEVGSIQCVDLVLNTIKISETHFPYNKKLKQEGNFCLIIANIQRVLKLWSIIYEYHLNNNSYFQWMQLISKIPEKWEFTIKQTGSDTKNVIIHDHHLIKASRILILKKSASKELYQILILQVLLI